MGYGSFRPADYTARQDYRQATGQQTFDQSSLHADLNPFGVNRESRDSAEHPESVPLAVLFDETGSMGDVPRVMQTKLPLLPTTLQLNGVQHMQVLTGAIGDEHSDRAPLQVGQFESDVRIDDQLNHIYLEGNGGGNGGESYGLGLYFMARHTRHDHFEKRGRRGLLVLTGDESPHRTVSGAAIRRFIGDEGGDLSIEAVLREVQRLYDVYFLHVDTSSARHQDSLNVWRGLLPERVTSLPDPNAVCETIALIAARHQGADATRAADTLINQGADPNAVRAAVSASRELDIRPQGTIQPGRASGRLPGAGDQRGTDRL